MSAELSEGWATKGMCSLALALLDVTYAKFSHDNCLGCAFRHSSGWGQQDAVTNTIHPEAAGKRTGGIAQVVWMGQGIPEELSVEVSESRG